MEGSVGMETGGWEWEWDLEEQVKGLVDGGEVGEEYCTLCVAEQLGVGTGEGYRIVGRVLRQMATWCPGEYEVIRAKCKKHGPQIEGRTFRMIRKRKE